MKIMLVDIGIRGTEIIIIDLKKREFLKEKLTEESTISRTEKMADKVLDIVLEHKVKHIYYEPVGIGEVFGDAFRYRAKKRLGWWKGRRVCKNFVGCRHSKLI